MLKYCYVNMEVKVIYSILNKWYDEEIVNNIIRSYVWKCLKSIVVLKVGSNVGDMILVF